jgi:putative two-component system response regulator
VDILIVHNQAECLASIGEVLRDGGYRVGIAGSLSSALSSLDERKPDLILVDAGLETPAGGDVLLYFKADHQIRDIPLILMTAADNDGLVERGLKMGAADYVPKPVNPTLMLARVRAHVDAKRARDWLRAQNSFLESEIARRAAENEVIQSVSIRALAHLAEIRDPETGLHILRTQAYVRLLAAQLEEHPRFSHILVRRFSDLLTLSAPLHDIGKVGIPDHILLKPGELSPQEWEVMKAHTHLGAEAIATAERDIDMPIDFLSPAKEIARWHHERWDGLGYPDGLRGEAIPVSARIMALADVFDAIISPRIYKHSTPFDEARDIIAESSGKHFDPEIVEVFLGNFGEFKAVAQRYHELHSGIPNSGVTTCG